MANLGQMTQWIRVVLSEQLDDWQIQALLNKADMEEVESWSWSRLVARGTINSFPATTFSSITVTQGSPTVTSQSGAFPIIPTGEFVLRISGQNYSPFTVVANPLSSTTLTLAAPYPGATQTDNVGTLFQLYYSMPGWQEIIAVQQQINLRYMTQEELYDLDPWLSEVASPALRFIPAGERLSTEDAKIILWPIETGANAYVVRGIRGYTQMVEDTDLPCVPSTVIMAKAIAEACETLGTLRGDSQWPDMRNYYRKVYEVELDKARERDRIKWGTLRQVRDGRPIVPGLDTVPFRDSSEWD